MTEEVKISSGLTAKAFLLGLIGCVISVITQYGRGGGWSEAVYHWWAFTGPGLRSMGMGFFVLLIIAFINYGSNAGWWKAHFTRQEVTVVLIFVLMGIFGSNAGNYQTYFRELWQEGQWVAMQSPDKQPEFWAKLPDNLVLGPKYPEPYAPLIAQGTRTLQWDFGPFIPMIVAGVLWYGTLQLFVTFGSTLFRHLYIDVEYLPMPVANVMAEAIELTQPASKKVRFFSSKLFLIGFILSFLWYLGTSWVDNLVYLLSGGSIRITYPWEALGYTLEPLWDFTKYAWLPWTGMFITLAPWEISWAIMLPVNVLITTLIAWFVIWVIFPFIYMANYWGPFTPGMADEVADIMIGPWRIDDYGFSRVALLYGMLIAAFITPLVMNWRHVSPVLKSLIREPPREFDPDRPISYRLTLILTVVFFILWYIVSVSLMCMHPVTTIVYMILISLAYFGSGRMVAETGAYYGMTDASAYWQNASWAGLPGAIAIYYTMMPIEPSIQTYMTMEMINHSAAGMCFGGERPAINTINSYGVAYRTKTRLKEILLILALGIVIALIGATFTHFFQRCWRLKPPKTRGYYIRQIVKNADQGKFYMDYDIVAVYPNETIIQIVIGFLIIFVISLLAPRIPYLRGLSVGGIIAALMFGPMVWSAWLVGFIIKYIVLKTGGTGMYEEKLKPIALGIFIGAIVALYVGCDIIGYLNWLIYG